MANETKGEGKNVQKKQGNAALFAALWFGIPIVLVCVSVLVMNHC